MTDYKTDSEVLIFTNGKQAGSVHGDTFRRTQKPQHFLKYPEISIAISTDVILQLQALNVQALEFRHAETGTKYKCSLSHFVEHGVKFNRGYGEQVSLPLTGFITTGKKLTPVYNETKQANEKQLAFAGWM